MVKFSCVSCLVILLSQAQSFAACLAYVPEGIRSERMQVMSGSSERAQEKAARAEEKFANKYDHIAKDALTALGYEIVDVSDAANYHFSVLSSGDVEDVQLLNVTTGEKVHAYADGFGNEKAKIKKATAKLPACGSF